jgi:hypothetical protein
MNEWNEYTLSDVWGSTSMKLDVSVGLCLEGIYGAFTIKQKNQMNLMINLNWLLRRIFFQSIEWKNRWFSKSSNPFFPRRSSTEQINCCNKSFALLDTSISSGNDNGIYTKSISMIQLK